MTIRIDERQCARLAQALSKVATRREWFVPRLQNVSRAAEADFWCLLIGICQQTRTVHGLVDGQAFRGSDYLIHRARARVLADPARFTPEAVKDWDADALRSFFSDDGRPSGTTLDQIDERVRLLRELGSFLSREHCGHFAHLVEAARDTVGGAAGIVSRLAVTEAYGDPARKKTWLLLLFLDKLGLVRLRDPEAIGLPVDYHILRVLLRAGAVVLEDDALRDQLVCGEPVTPEQDAALRSIVSRAGKTLAAGRDLFEIDNLLWMIGRNCCFYEHDPVCREPKPCAHRSGCSLIDSTDYACADLCPLEGTCRGSLDPAFAALRETAIDTHWY